MDAEPNTNATIGEVMRRRRAELGMSQTDLATAAEVTVRQIRRYESGDQQPLLSVGIAIARALKLPVLELVGVGGPDRLNLSGEWWMSWQTSKDGFAQVTAQTVQFTQQEDELVHMQTTSRGTVNQPDGERVPITVDMGGYHWAGELRIWDRRILMGWYSANDGAVGSKGTLFFALHTHGQQAGGIWTGISHDGDLLSGWGALGQSEDDVVGAVHQLKESRGALALRTDPDRAEDN